MLDRVVVLMTVAPLVLLVLVIEMVRSRKLREDYSLLWLATALGMLVLAVLREPLLTVVAEAMGIFYPPTALFVIGMGFLLLILLQYSTVITQLARENKQAAQHIALLNQRVRTLEAQVKDPANDAR